MKKLFAVLLAFLSLAAFLPPASAESAANGTEAAIIVPGVIETMLTTDPAAGRDGRFYAPVKAAIAKELGNLLSGAVRAHFFGRNDALTEAALRLEDAALGQLKMGPDGVPTYSLTTPVSGAAQSAYAAMLKSGIWDEVRYGAQIAPALAERIGPENVFVFTYDWRLGSPTVAARFDSFVEEVKALTGCERVNVYSDSYGCQIVAYYLYALDGARNVGRAVFDSPAWTGTALFRGLMDENEDTFRFNLIDGADTLLNFLQVETDLKPLLRLLPDRNVQRVAFAMVRHAWDEYLRTAPGLWCCCAAEDYEEMKARFLDPAENAAVIAEADMAQYGVMRHIPEALAAAEAAGVKLSVIMNEGTRLFAGVNVNGDGVVDAAHGSGGECLPYGQTFTDGRSGARVSPANDLDLTNAFLPDRTWSFYGQTHGQSYWDDASCALVVKLLLTDEIATVDSDPRFPQFSAAHCPAYDVSLRLNGRGGCTLRPDEGAVQAVIRNDSEKNCVLLTGVKLNGLGYSVSRAAALLRPGETKTVTLTPDAGAAAPAYGSAEISYVEFDSLPLRKTRTQYFSVAAERQNT